MKKLFTAIIFGLFLIPQLALAQEEPTPTPQEKQAPAPKDDPKKSPQCQFIKTVETPACITEKEREKNMIVVLEEAIDTVEDIEDYEQGGSEIRSCQRMIQIENCQPNPSEQPIIKTKTKIVKNLKCTPAGKKGDNSRTICEDVTVILTSLEEGGSGLLNVYVGLIYRWAAGVVGVVAVLIIIINSILIITSQGDQSKIDNAKGRIMQSLAGIAILFLSSLILYAVNPDFFKFY